MNKQQTATTPGLLATAIKYRPGLCLFCDRPIKKTGRLWCLMSHMKKHDKQLKTKPVKYRDVIYRTANDLEKAIRIDEAKHQLLQKENEKEVGIMRAQLSKLDPNSPEYKELMNKILIHSTLIPAI